jgi:hypothetical protein
VGHFPQHGFRLGCCPTPLVLPLRRTRGSPLGFALPARVRAAHEAPDAAAQGSRSVVAPRHSSWSVPAVSRCRCSASRCPCSAMHCRRSVVHCRYAADAAPRAARAAPCTADAASCAAVTLPMQRHALPVQRHALPTQRHVLPLQRLSPERNLGSIEGAGALASRHPVGCATSQMRSPRLAASSRRCARLPGNRVAASPRAAAPQMRPRLALPAHCSAIVHAALVAARSVSLAAVTAQCPVCAAPLLRKKSRFNRGSKCARPPAPVGCITSQVRSPQ